MGSARPFVFQRNQAFRIRLVLDQREVALREPAWEEWDAFAEQDRDDAEVKLIDDVVLKKIAGELATANKPNVFPGTLPELTDEGGRSLVDKHEIAAFTHGLGPENT